MAEVLQKVTDENLEQSFLSESSDGEVAVYLLPGDNIAVPILDMFSCDSEATYVHVRDFKCSLGVCSKVKSKKHTLVEKGTPHCAHSILGNIFVTFLFIFSCEATLTYQNTSLAAKGALANHLQRRTPCKIQNGRQGAPKWPPGSGKVFGRSKQLSQNKFFDPSTPSMRKGLNREKTDK